MVRLNVFKVLGMALFAVAFLCLPQYSAATNYINGAPNTADAPVYGTVISTETYVVKENSAIAGDALDNFRVYMYDSAPGQPFQIIRWDMGTSTNFIRVYPDAENGTAYPWDYLQWSLYGSATGGTNSAEWTQLFNPTSATGSILANNLTITGNSGPFDPLNVYKQMNPGFGTNQNPGFGDTFTMDFDLGSTSYRYFGIKASDMAWAAGHYDPEINAMATNSAVPEPTTMLLFGLGLVALAGVKRFKK
jgi:hypothetical protein